MKQEVCTKQRVIGGKGRGTKVVSIAYKMSIKLVSKLKESERWMSEGLHTVRDDKDFRDGVGDVGWARTQPPGKGIYREPFPYCT
jgi:hypothetical protein